MSKRKRQAEADDDVWSTIEALTTRVRNLENQTTTRGNGSSSDQPYAAPSAEADRQSREFGFFESSRADQVRISKAFDAGGERQRYITMKMEIETMSEISEDVPCEIMDTCHLKRSHGSRVEVKALALVDDEGFDQLIIQRWDKLKAGTKKEAMSFRNREIDKLMIFLLTSYTGRFSTDTSTKTMLEDLLELVREQVQERTDPVTGRMRLRSELRHDT